MDIVFCEFEVYNLLVWYVLVIYCNTITTVALAGNFIK